VRPKHLPSGIACLHPFAIIGAKQQGVETPAIKQALAGALSSCVKALVVQFLGQIRLGLDIRRPP